MRLLWWGSRYKYYANEPQYYVIRTLSIFYIVTNRHIRGMAKRSQNVWGVWILISMEVRMLTPSPYYILLIKLTAWSKAASEELTVAQPGTKFHAFHRNRWLIIVAIKTGHYSLSWVRPIFSTHVHSIHLWAILILSPLTPANGRQHRGCIIPQAVTHSLVLLKMGKIIARNLLSWLELLISRYCCI